MTLKIKQNISTELSVFLVKIPYRYKVGKPRPLYGLSQVNHDLSLYGQEALAFLRLQRVVKVTNRNMR